MSFITIFSRYVVIPLWIAHDNSPRLSHYRLLRKTQYLDLAELRRIQLANLKDTLVKAYRNTAYYRRLFDTAAFNPETFESFEDLVSIPILEKDAVRHHYDDLLSTQHRKGYLSEFRTGGSTGKPVVVVKDFSTVEKSNASAYRVFEWAGGRVGEPWGMVWGNPPQYTTIKQKLRNLLIDREIYLDTMHLTDRSMTEFCHEWRNLRPSMLRGHSHSIYIFASFCLRNSITDIRPKGIISSSMMLIPSERAVIEKAFNCRVTDLYGCEEVGLIGCECEQHSGLHVDMENIYVEIVDPSGKPVPDGEQGAVVVTSLISDAMPLIRYKLGDISSFRTQPCTCGRGLMLLDNIAGRVADFFVRKDGSVVAGVSLVERTLTKFPGIAQMQMVQEDIDNLTLRIARDVDYSADTEREVLAELKRSIGEHIVVHMEFVDSIPQEPSGKYRFAISKVKNPYSV